MKSTLQVGTSSVVYPAAMFAPQVAFRGVAVAEFNMENTPATQGFKYAAFTVIQPITFIVFSGLCNV